MMWDMADYFIGGLGLPKGDWESYAFLLPVLLLVVIGLLSCEKKKRDASTDQAAVSAHKLSGFQRSSSLAFMVRVCKSRGGATPLLGISWSCKVAK